MERRLHKKIDSYIRGFKNDICQEIQQNPLSEYPDYKDDVKKLINFVYEYNNFELNKEDFMKRTRVKSTIPAYERCSAKRASGEQCTRRKRDDCQFCGTHSKGTPHGIITDNEPLNTTTKIEVSAIDIKGIVYYLDNNTNVYDTEDIIANKNNPRVIAKYEKHGDVYSIPEYNI